MPEACRALLAGHRRRDGATLDESEPSLAIDTVRLSNNSHALLTAPGKKQRPKETPGYIQVRNSRPRRGVLNEPSVQSRSHSLGANQVVPSARLQLVQVRERINPLMRAVEPFALSLALFQRRDDELAV